MTPNGIAPLRPATSADTPGFAVTRCSGREKTEQTIQSYLDAVTSPPSTPLCLKLARSYDRIATMRKTCRWALSLVDAGDDYAAWQAGWTLFFNATHNAPYGPLREQSKWRSPAAIPRLNSVRWCALRRRNRHSDRLV